MSRRVLSWWGRKQQIKGVKEAKLVINGDAGRTAEVLKEIGARQMSVAMPMVFNLEPAVTNARLAPRSLRLLRPSMNRISLFCHMPVYPGSKRNFRKADSPSTMTG